jgi:hypothetical protein
LLGLALYAEYAVNFTLAFVLGIALQYFSIKPMRDLGRRDGVVAALKADTLSLVTFEVGDFARMAVVQLVHRPALACGHGRVLVPDADRDDPRLRDVPPGRRQRASGSAAAGGDAQRCRGAPPPPRLGPGRARTAGGSSRRSG